MKAGPLVAALFGVSVALSCRDAAGPTTGAARVAVTTGGLDLDADGYMVTVEGQLPRSVNPVDAVTIRDLATGAHTVALGGVAANCTVSGDAAPVVMVTAGDTTQVAFTVGCAAMSGSVQVTVTTEGVDLDPDGFAVALDGGVEHVLPVNGAMLFSPVLIGEHAAQLRGLAENCSANGALTRNVTVAPGAPGDTIRPTVGVAYTVACTALVGDLRVTTATTGTDLDSDGYTVSVDGGPGRAVDVNGALVIAEVRSGEHVVGLDGLAGNCTAGEPNPRAVAVTFGAAAGVTFAVTCRAQTGSLRLTVTTTGVDVPDGYTVFLDNIPEVGIPDQPWVPANGAIVISGLAPGQHFVFLRPLPANCAFSGPIPQQVLVIAGDTAEVTIEAACAALPPPTGTLRVTTATSGVYFEHDTYVVSVDSLGGGDVAANGVLILSGLSAADHQVKLRVSSNCDVSGANPRPVSIVAGDTAEVAFAVTCRTTSGTIEVTTATSGAAPDSNGYAIGVDPSCDIYGNDCSYSWSDVVSADGTVRFVVNAGSHTVWLEDVAANCAVPNGISDTLEVAAGDTAKVTFAVVCSDLAGDVRVTTVTTGADLDPNGYTVRVDDLAWHIAPVNGAVTVPGPWAASAHAVELLDIAANCTVGGDNPRMVTIQAGDTAEVAFAVECAAIERDGWLHVTTTTTGTDLDPAYIARVLVDCGESMDGPCEVASGRLETNDAATFRLAAAQYILELDEVAPNCSVAESPSRLLTVSPGDTVAIAFEVVCTAFGSVRVTTVTAGVDFNGQGYTVSLDGLGGGDVPANGVALFTRVSAGDHRVELRSVPPNCSVTGANPQAVNVLAGATTDVAFAVTCLPTMGILEVTTATSGSTPDSNGYAVGVDPNCDAYGRDCEYSWSEVVGATDTARFVVNAGYHSVWLEDVAPNCAVSGAPSDTVHVAGGDTATVAFAITCSDLTGDLRVSAVTTGADLDPNGYTVRVDERAWHIVPVNGVVIVPGPWSRGEHVVELSDVAANCSVAGANPRTATIMGGDTVPVSFAVACTALPGVGSIRVTTATIGADLDPDGYAAGVDYVCGDNFVPCHYLWIAPVGVTGAVTIADVDPGEHEVSLTGVAGNCAVIGPNPQPVTVTDGAVAEVAFAVTCVETGSLRVTTATTGMDLDPNGYWVRVDAGLPQLIGVAGAILFEGLGAGDHSVDLGGVATNCAVEGGNSRTVRVTADATTEVGYAVTCRATTGTLHVSVATTGTDLDPDGYRVYVTGSCRLVWDGDNGLGYECDYERTESLGVNGALTISGVPAGVSVSLQDVAPNCTVGGQNPREVSVTLGGTADVAFAVACTTLP